MYTTILLFQDHFVICFSPLVFSYEEMTAKVCSLTLGIYIWRHLESSECSRLWQSFVST